MSEFKLLRDFGVVEGRRICCFAEGSWHYLVRISYMTVSIYRLDRYRHIRGVLWSCRTTDWIKSSDRAYCSPGELVTALCHKDPVTRARLVLVAPLYGVLPYIGNNTRALDPRLQRWLRTTLPDLRHEDYLALNRMLS